MKFMLYSIFLASFLTPALAGDAVDRIAAEAEKCFKTPQGQTTEGTMACSRQAYTAYDKQMNELYRRVMESVDPQSQERIKDAQRRWLAYRDAQRRADDGPWRADRGSMTSPDIEAMNVDAIRQRIQELRYYAP